jgi:O-antigen/teichoic acid export membrane protein
MYERVRRLLRWSEKYTKTDMVYLASSSFWLHSTSWLVALCSFLLYIVFGNVLSVEVYGTYQYLISLGALIGAFTLTGMNGAVSRAVTQGFEGSYRRAVSVQLRWGVAPLLGSWAVAAYYLLNGNQTIGFGLLLLGVFIPLNTALNTYGAYLAAKADFKRNFKYSLLVNLPYLVGVALVAVSLPAALALLAANLITQAIGYFAAHRQTLRIYKPNDREDPGAMRYGRHLSIMNFIGAAAAQVDNILVFNMLGPAQLALYSFATAVPDRLNIFRLLGVSAFPKFANRTPQEVARSLRRKVLLSVIIAGAVALAYAAAAPLFFSIFSPFYKSDSGNPVVQRFHQRMEWG